MKDLSDISILLLEDNPSEAERIRGILEDSPEVRANVLVVPGLPEAVHAVAHTSIDIILIDVGLKSGHGFAAITSLKARVPHTPIIVLCSGEEGSVEAISRGAQDFLAREKFDPPAIVRAIRYSIGKTQTEEVMRLRLRRLELLKTFFDHLQTITDLRSILADARDIFPEYLGVTRVSILLHDEMRQCLIDGSQVESDGVTALNSGEEGQPLGHSISGKCFAEGQPIVIHDCSASDLIPPEYVASLHLKSVAAVPIVARDKPIGVLRIDDTQQVFRFSNEDVEFFSMLAEQLGTVIQNAQLLEQHKGDLEKLRASEEGYRRIVETAAEGIVSVDDTGRIVFANRRMAEMLALDVAGLAGRCIFELLDASVRPQAERLFLSGTVGMASDRDFEFSRADGSRFWGILSISPIVGPDGRYLGALAMVTDVTFRKRAEREGDTLRNLGHRLSASTTAREAAMAMLDAADQLFGWDCAYIDLYSRHTGNMEVIASFDLLDGTRTEVPAFSGGTPGEFTKRAFEEGPLLILRQSLEGSEFETDLSSSPSKPSASLMFVPLRRGRENVGIASAQSYRPQAYSVQHLELLQMIGNYGVDALVRTYAEADLRENELRFRQIMKALREVIFMSTPDGMGMVYVSPAFEKIWGRTCESLYSTPASWLESVHPDDRQRLNHLYITGKALEGFTETYRIIRGDGMVRWVNVRTSPVFDKDGKVHRLVGAADDITESIERQIGQEALLTLVTALRTAATRSAMGPVILSQVLKAFTSEGAALGILDEPADEIRIELGLGEMSMATGSRLARQEGIGGRVLTSLEPYLTQDLDNDGIVALRSMFGDTRSLACVPLVAHEQPIGMLYMGRRHIIAPEEVRLLRAISDVAANALHRATLFEETQRRLQQLTAVRAVDMAISSSLDLRLTLSILLDNLTGLLGIHAAGVLLFNPHTQMLEYVARPGGFRTQSFENVRFRLGEGTAGRAALQRSIVAFPNLLDVSVGRTQLTVSEEFVAYYGVPLVAKGQLKGVMELYHRAPLAADSDWIGTLEALAAQAAIALDNADLFENLQRSNAELMNAYETTLEGWSRALDLRDHETEGHAQRVTTASVRLAQVMGIPDAELVHVRRGALLHDIGKMAIPDAILLKPGPLTDEEWEVMRMHPVYAYELLSPITYLRPSIDIPYCHHERWDGKGYPRGLKGEQIPQAARIFSIVDIWDALGSERPYRKPWSEKTVVQHVRAAKGKALDPQVVDAFLDGGIGSLLPCKGVDL